MHYSDIELRNYGFNIIIKDYAKFPHYLPLPCHMEHGWAVNQGAIKSDLVTNKPLMLVFSKRRVKAWKKYSKIPVVIIGSPFVHYKLKHNIVTKSDARGTVVFPGHSTYFVKNIFSIEGYCLELKQLPKMYHPITICLFWLDYIDKSSDIYRQMGFEVVTAGYKITNSLDFVKNFYDILSSHKYATSNDIGSHVFYAIDMGIPFFLTGKSTVLVNKKGQDVNIGIKTKISEYPIGIKAIKLFSTGPVCKITEGQKQFVQEEMGINDCISPDKLNKLFWKYYNKELYWIKFFLPYLFVSLFTIILFNGPWIKYLMYLRKKMTE
jgi:hypothetical protein